MSVENGPNVTDRLHWRPACKRGAHRRRIGTNRERHWIQVGSARPQLRDTEAEVITWSTALEPSSLLVLPADARGGVKSRHADSTLRSANASLILFRQRIV